MKMLASKLYELEVQKRNVERDALEANKSDIGWGSQIRNYVLDQSRIKDLRTGIERSDTQKVLDGDLDEFVEASLKSGLRSEEHTSELQSLMRIAYAVFCLNKKQTNEIQPTNR